MKVILELGAEAIFMFILILIWGGLMNMFDKTSFFKPRPVLGGILAGICCYPLSPPLGIVIYWGLPILFIVGSQKLYRKLTTKYSWLKSSSAWIVLGAIVLAYLVIARTTLSPSGWAGFWHAE